VKVNANRIIGTGTPTAEIIRAKGTQIISTAGKMGASIAKPSQNAHSQKVISNTVRMATLS